MTGRGIWMEVVWSLAMATSSQGNKQSVATKQRWVVLAQLGAGVKLLNRKFSFGESMRRGQAQGKRGHGTKEKRWFRGSLHWQPLLDQAIGCDYSKGKRTNKKNKRKAIKELILNKKFQVLGQSGHGLFKWLEVLQGIYTYLHVHVLLTFKMTSLQKGSMHVSVR